MTLLIFRTADHRAVLFGKLDNRAFRIYPLISPFYAPLDEITDLANRIQLELNLCLTIETADA